MKRYERELEIVNLFQQDPLFEPIVCPQDGIKMNGRAHIGHVYLECPLCGHRQYKIPPQITALYFEQISLPSSN